VGKAFRLPKSQATERCFTQAALLENIRLGWKGLPKKNTHAYLSPLLNYKDKSFMILALEANVIKYFLRHLRLG
jgi:hypothetical protein